MGFVRKFVVLDQGLAEAKSGRPVQFHEWRSATKIGPKTDIDNQSRTFAQSHWVLYSSGVIRASMRPAGSKNVTSIHEDAKRDQAILAGLEPFVQAEEGLKGRWLQQNKGARSSFTRTARRVSLSRSVCRKTPPGQGR